MLHSRHVKGVGSSMQGAGSLGGGTQGPTKELQKGKVSVWWDIENCPVPRNDKARKVTCNIIQALRELGYQGEISLHAYGNTDIFSHDVHDALSSTGVPFIHVPSGRDATDKRIIVDMMTWGVKHDPASYLLISDDRDFWYMLEKMKKREYNVMLAVRRVPEIQPPADTVWLWDKLLVGGPPLQLV